MFTRSMRSARKQLTKPFDNPEILFRNLKIRFRKEEQEASAETSTSISASSMSTSSTTIATQTMVSEVNSNPNWFVSFFRFLQTVLGMAGGTYAIYVFIENYLIQSDEILEVLVLRRKWCRIQFKKIVKKCWVHQINKCFPKSSENTHSSFFFSWQDLENN